MLSFKELTKENTGAVLDELSGKPEWRDALEEIVSSFSEYIDENGDTGVAVCVSCGCLLSRIFDMGRYLFIYPIELERCADTEAAIDEVREYAVREEVPLVLCDVPREKIGELLLMIRHANIDCEDEAGESFRVEAKSECSLLSCFPEYEMGDISLVSERDEDAESIAALVKDDEVNEYWGYDFREDIPSERVPDSYFLETARAEFARGVAMTLAIRYKGEFVGECVYYAFDYKGGCEIALRIKRDTWGNKIGSRALRGAIEIAERIGLLNLYTVIDERNTRSIGMVKGEFELTRCEGGRCYFRREICRF